MPTPARRTAEAPKEDFSQYDLLPCAVLIVGADDYVHYANPPAEQLLGQSMQALKAEPLHSSLLPASTLPALIEKARQGVAVKEHSHSLLLKRGTRLVHLHLAAIEPEGSVVIIGEDLSVAAKLEPHRHQREIARVAGLMTAMLAHEVKNPLASIRGAAQLLEETAAADDAHLAILIRSEVDRISGILGQIELFANPGLGEAEPINIHQLLDEARNLAEPFARHCRIECQFDPSLPTLMGNREQLRILLLNLIKNASEALVAAENPTIRLVTSCLAGTRYRAPGSGHWHISPLSIQIEDNGPGVPEELRERIFDPYVSAHGSGKGLGLAIAARIAAEHGGQLDYTRKQGLTQFTLLLPQGSTS